LENLYRTPSFGLPTYNKLLRNRTISILAKKNKKASKRSFLSEGKIRRNWFSALMILVILGLGTYVSLDGLAATGF
jgi:hypothetical protein